MEIKKRIPGTKLFSKATILWNNPYHGNPKDEIVFLAGIVGSRAKDKDITEQTADILAQLDEILQEVSSNKRYLIDAMIFLKDMNDYDAMNSVWQRWLEMPESRSRVKADPPTRTCIQATPPLGFLVEIKVVALIPEMHYQGGPGF